MFSKIFGWKQKSSSPKTKDIEHYLVDAENYVKRTQGNQFHVYLIAYLQWAIETPAFEGYCSQYSLDKQPIIRMAYTSYIVCLMIKSMEEHLSEKQVNEGLNGIVGYIASRSWYNADVFDKLWRVTLRRMPYEATPGKHSGIVSLLTFPLINIDLAGFHDIVNSPVTPDSYLALDTWILKNRSTIINASSAIAANALENGWVN